MNAIYPPERTTDSTVTLFCDTANMSGITTFVFTLNAASEIDGYCIMGNSYGWKMWVCDDYRKGFRLARIDDFLSGDNSAATYHRTRKAAIQAQRQRIAAAYAKLDEATRALEAA